MDCPGETVGSLSPLAPLAWSEVPRHSLEGLEFSRWEGGGRGAEFPNPAGSCLRRVVAGLGQGRGKRGRAGCAGCRAGSSGCFGGRVSRAGPSYAAPWSCWSRAEGPPVLLRSLGLAVGDAAGNYSAAGTGMSWSCLRPIRAAHAPSPPLRTHRVATSERLSPQGVSLHPVREPVGLWESPDRRSGLCRRACHDAPYAARESRCVSASPAMWIREREPVARARLVREIVAGLVQHEAPALRTGHTLPVEAGGEGRMH